MGMILGSGGKGGRRGRRSLNAEINVTPFVDVMLVLLIVFRLAGLITGCFYGPFIYAVLPLGGLYLTFDCLALYVTHANGSV